MDGREIFSMVMTEVPGNVERCLSLNSLETDDINAWVFQQANACMLKALCSGLKSPMEKMMLKHKKCIIGKDRTYTLNEVMICLGSSNSGC